MFRTGKYVRERKTTGDHQSLAEEGNGQYNGCGLLFMVMKMFRN